jgi:hypothetical protein
LNILPDESAPRLIKTSLSQFSIRTVQELGWTGMKNGDLLAAAEGQFDVFITADRSLRHQQSLAGRRLAVLVLPSHQVPIVMGLIPTIEQALTAVQPGTFTEISLPS